MCLIPFFISQLSNHLSKAVSTNWASSSRHPTYLDRLQAAVTTSIPPCDSLLLLARDAAKMAEIRDCIRALRTRIMRELCTEIMPAFLASSEFEILLWELDSRRAYLVAEKEKRNAQDNDDSFDSSLSEGLLETPETPPPPHDYDRDEVELVHTLLHKGSAASNGMMTPQKSSSGASSTQPPENPYLVVPDGAVQRLLRQTELPGTMTMHRAPLDMLEDMAREQKEMEGGPVSLLLAFDTEGGNIVDSRSLKVKRRSLSVSRDYPAHLKNVEDDDGIVDGDDVDQDDEGDQKRDVEGVLFSDSPEKQTPASTKEPEDVTVKYIHPIGANMAATKFNKNYLGLIPDSINNFLIPHGQCIYDTPSAPKLFNFAVNMPNNSLVYGCCLLMYREVQVRISVIKPKVPPTPVALPPINNISKRDVSGRGHIPKTPGTGAPVNTPHHTPHRPEHHPSPKTPLSSFKSLASTNGGTPSIDRLATPKGVGGVGEWIGQMSLSSVKESPFMGRIKGLALGTPTTVARSSEVRFAELNSSVSKHSRGGSDDISSGSDGSTLSSIKRKGNATINHVEDTYTKTMLLQEQDVFITTTPPLDREDVLTPPPPEISNEDDGTDPVMSSDNNKDTQKHVDNSILIASTPRPSSGPHKNFQLYSSQIASSSDSTGSRDEVLVPMYVANGFCMLSSVPCINALRQPLSLLASNQERLKGVLESMNCGGYSDLEISEDDIDYEYSDDSCDELDRDLSLDNAVKSNVYEINAKTRSLRALNIMETDRSLVNLRHAHAEFNLNMKLPSVLRHGGAQDFNAEMILRSLSPKNFVTVLIAFLLEFKIAVVSSKISALLAMGEFLKVLISPLKWSHVYCPLLPKKFSNDLLQCPTPFFVGVQRDFLDLSEMPDDVIVLDMDQNSCTVTESLASALYAGKKLTKTLTSLLLPSLHCCDDVVPPAKEINTFMGNDMIAMSSCNESMVREVLRSCKLFVADMLVGLEECCTFGIDHDEALVLFDETMYIASKESRSKDSMLSCHKDSDFFAQFLRTQCFSLCIIGTILKKLGPDSRPPSRPSSPYISIPSPTLLAIPQVSSGAEHSHVHALSQQLPTTPVHMS